MPTADSQQPIVPFGVRIAGVGSAVPDRVLSNVEFEKMMDTTDEWITQRTGIRERRIIDPSKGESNLTLSLQALRNALENAGMQGSDLDMVILASVTTDMACPSTACRIAHEIGASPAAAFDMIAACSGYVYAMNVADSLVRSGRHRAIGFIGCDTLSTICDYTDRTVSILFGDAAGAAILVRDDEDATTGCIYQTMASDGSMWKSLYIPRKECDIPPEDSDNPIRIGCLRMQGREVYKFAVNRFREVIEDALIKTGLDVDDISQFICHQSNVRIIESAMEKIGLPPEKVHINIDRYGNSSAGSVGLCLDQVWRAGKVKRGDTVVFVAFGGGLTWASSVWRI